MARAFSGHRFEEVLDRLADDVTWALPGGEPSEGRQAVVDACRATASELSSTTTTWLRFVCAAGDLVAVDTRVHTQVDSESLDEVGAAGGSPS